ncbi:MAG: DUF2085 domain-containing protein [Candidatus Korobacteraceae bacterium]
MRRNLAHPVFPRSISHGIVAARWNWWALVAIAIVAAALAVPYALTHGFLALGLVLQRGFGLVCHQRPERCFWVFGAPVAVCARCLGIYIGAAIGLLMRTSRSIALRLAAIAAAINLLDGITEVAGLHGNWMAVRFALGLLLGAVGALLISSSVGQEDVPPAEAGST